MSACLYLRAGGLVANPVLSGYVLLELGIVARRDGPKIGRGRVTEHTDESEDDVSRRDIAGAVFGLGFLAVDARQVDLSQACTLARAPDYAFDSRSQVAADAVRQAVSR